MCEEKQPTLSVITPLRAKLLVHYLDTEEDSALLGEMKETMSRELSQRYKDVQQVLHKASALDARFKTLPFLSEEEKEAAFQRITYEALELWDQKVS